MPDCLFCKIVSGDIPSVKIAEDEEFLAFLDIAPISEGHTLVIPKRHVKDFSELPEELMPRWSSFVKKVMANVQDGVGADGINLGMNNGSAAGQVVFHQHLHVIPRFEGDGLKHWPGSEKSPEELEAVKERITK